ncbi:hypothetical protein K1Y37_10035 [Serratia marcescens]|uniref:hypothetical protein n=1 Tax=Serratia TaxID=613 RepID=UPI0018E89949|nr:MULTISPECIES: hypothetical protein [Serratia]MBJ2078344.1 hypothetical protein [Serratia ureilytica]MCW6023215.1 hypothetical protein [Serratia marcescens]
MNSLTLILIVLCVAQWFAVMKLKKDLRIADANDHQLIHEIIVCREKYKKVLDALWGGRSGEEVVDGITLMAEHNRLPSGVVLDDEVDSALFTVSHLVIQVLRETRHDVSEAECKRVEAAITRMRQVTQGEGS